MTKSRDEMAERAERLYWLEQKMLAYVGRGTGRLEHEMATRWGVTPRSVRAMIDEVRARWAAEAPVDREDRRANMRRTLEELAYEARTEGRPNVALRAYELLVSLDGLNAPTKTETTVAVVPNDSAAAVARDALALLSPEERAELAKHLEPEG